MKNNLLLACSLTALSYAVASANIFDSAVNTAESAVNKTVVAAERTVDRVVPSREPMMYTSGTEDEPMMEAAPMQEQGENDSTMHHKRGVSHHERSYACGSCAKTACPSCNPSK